MKKRGMMARIAAALGVTTSIAAIAALPVAQSGPAAAAPADALPAVFATGGSGRFVDSIQWLQWADYDTYFKDNPRPHAPVLDKGQTRTFVNTRDMGEAGTLVTYCTLSNLQHLGHGTNFGTGNWPNTDEHAFGPLVATVPGTWAGDALDNMYNVGGPGNWAGGAAVWQAGMTYPHDYTNNNQMVIGLANGYAYLGDNSYENPDSPWVAGNLPTGLNSRVSVDLECRAELETDGATKPVPLSGLVFADAEASSTRDTSNPDSYQNEWVQARTTQAGVKWRVLDTLRSANCIPSGGTAPVTTNAVFLDGQTVRLAPSGNECVYQNGGTYANPNGEGGPDVVMFMEGATKATVTIQGGGYSAVALGLVIATDFGDAPESYGIASALFQPTWSGGQVTDTTDAFNAGLANMSAAAPRLGSTIDAEGYMHYSDDALGDDNSGVDDEDGVVLPPGGIRTQPGASYTQAVTCARATSGNPGTIAGWIDWNGNGTFDVSEKSNEVQCSAQGTATLRWTVPNDVARSVDGEAGSKDTYMRVRINGDGTPLAPTGVATIGEVEDYKVAVRVPTLQLIKTVNGQYASSEVPALTADQWSLTGVGAVTIDGNGTTGDPKVVSVGDYALSESSAQPASVGYTPGNWVCEPTPGTVGESFSSQVTTTSNGSATVTVRNQDRVTCRIENSTKPGSVSWEKKASDTGELLGGTEWRLAGPSFPNGTTVTDCVGACDPAPGRDQDPAAGKFRIEGLTWGTYTVTETRAPEGFHPTTTVFTFQQIDAQALAARLVDADGVDEGAILNLPITGSVSWKKVDTSGNVLKDSVWTVSGGALAFPVSITDCVAASDAECPAGDFVDTDSRPGYFKVTGLRPGHYMLVESSAPAGYQLDSTEHNFTISDAAPDYAFAAAFVNEQVEVPKLPLTGGASADAFLIWGGSLLGLAGFGAFVRRRKQVMSH